MKSEKGLALLAKVREICSQWPEVTEAVDGFGHTSFRVKDKPFVIMGEHENPEQEASLSIKTLPTTQDVLLQQGGFYKTPYIGRHGWVSVSNTDELNWEELKELMLEGYLRTAPKKLANQVQKVID